MNEILYVIYLDREDESEGAQHHQTHPHLVRIYSEVDKVDHKFRVRPETALNHVFREFYEKTSTPHSGLDRFKNEENSDDLAPFGEMTIEELLRDHHCRDLVWIFTNEPIRILVDAEPKFERKRVLSFLDIVKLAYENPASDVTIYTVTFCHADQHQHQGTLANGEKVHIKDGTEFCVSPSNRS